MTQSDTDFKFGEKVFVHRYKWAHHVRRRKYRKWLAQGKVVLISQNKEGWLYGLKKKMSEQTDAEFILECETISTDVEADHFDLGDLDHSDLDRLIALAKEAVEGRKKIDDLMLHNTRRTQRIEEQGKRIAKLESLAANEQRLKRNSYCGKE